MGVLVNVGEKKTLTFSAIDVRGISLTSYNIAGEGTSGGDENVNGIDWSRVYVNMVLHQSGKSTQICASTVKPLAQHLNYLNRTFEYCGNRQNVDQYDPNTFVADSTIDFGSVINLRGDDSLVVEIRVQSDACNSSWTDASYVEADALEGVGLQYTTPTFHTFAINGGESKFSHSLGDNCTAVTLQNISSSPTQDQANSPWQNARLFSDRFNVNDDWGQLWTKRNSLFASNQARYQSFVLSLETTDATQVQLDLYPTNNSTNENYLCYSAFEVTKSVVAQATKRAKKHEVQAISKIQKG